MARPKSEEKRAQILSAATQVFAKNGLSASTASITSAAGVAEGTLFNYFKGKDDLMNTLYLEIKTDLAECMLGGAKPDGSPKEAMHHIWNNYIDWGARNPDQLAVLHKLKVWEGLTPETREATVTRFAHLHCITEAAIIGSGLKDVPHDFMIAMFSAQVEVVLQYIKQDPGKESFYKDIGFELFWFGIHGQDKRKK
jgi:Transcriptional regulator